MPASKKNKENLKKAVDQSYKEWSAENPGRMKEIARSKMKKVTPKPKKSRAENKAAVQRTLKLLRKQKGK